MSPKTGDTVLVYQSKQRGLRDKLFFIAYYCYIDKIYIDKTYKKLTSYSLSISIDS